MGTSKSLLYPQGTSLKTVKPRNSSNGTAQIQEKRLTEDYDIETARFPREDVTPTSIIEPKINSSRSFYEEKLLNGKGKKTITVSSNLLAHFPKKHLMSQQNLFP